MPAARTNVPAPELDEFGVLRNGERWVALSPVQEALAAALLERFGAPVGRRALAQRAWPEGEPERGLDTHMAKLRARIAPLGLRVVTIRGRGYVLTA